MIIFILFIQSAGADNNLLPNPGFETGVLTPHSWNFITVKGNTPYWDASVHHEGSRSIRIQIQNNKNRNSGYPLSDIIEVSPASEYNFSSWVKTQGAGGTNAPAVRFVELDADKNWIRETPITFEKGTNPWTLKSKVINTSLNTRYAYVYAGIVWGYGTFWLDDIEISQKIAPAPTPSPTPIPTPSPTATTPAPIPSGTIYYVAKNGSDSNDGTEMQPWLTVAKAANTAIAGDTVYVKEGVYREQIWVKNSGSTGKWINFAAYPNDTVTIDGTGISMIVRSNGDKWFGLFNILGKSYIKISGFRIINSDYAGFFVTKDYATETPSSNIMFINNYIEKTWGAAIIMLGEAAARSTNYTVDGNVIVQSHFSGDARAMEGITLGHNLENFEIKNNIIRDSRAGGIDVKNGVSNGKIFRNTCTNSTYGCIYVDGWTDGASNIDVFENIVYNMALENENDSVSGINVASEQGGRVENIMFYNNIIYNNPATAMMIAWYSLGPVNNITIISNTFYNNGIGNKYRGGIVLDYDNATGVIVRNNIVSQNYDFQIWSKDSDAIIDHNLIDGYRGYYWFETKGANYVEGNPQFIDPGFSDFHLKNTSPSIDKGTLSGAPEVDFDGIIRPSGTGYDIGAFEAH